MKKNPISHIKRYHKHYLGLIAFLFLLLMVSSWLFVRNYKPILSDRLKKQIYFATDSLYRVSFSEVHLNPVLGIFTLDSFHLIPDTATYNRMKSEHRSPPNLFDIYISRFQLRKMHLWSLVRNREVKIGVIKIENPAITVYHDTERSAKNTEAIREALFKLTSRSLKTIQIDHIGMHNIIFKYKNKLNNNAGKMELGDMDLVFRDIRIDSSTLHDSSRFLFAGSVWFHLAHSRFFLADSLYRVSTGGISFSVNEGKVAIQDLRITPQKNERDFDKGLTYRKDLFKASADSLYLEGIDLPNLEADKWYIGKFRLHDFNLNVYMNAEKPVKPVEKPLLRSALLGLSEDIRIDTLYLKNGTIVYRERNPVSKQTGYVTFENIEGTVQNITNDSLQILRQPMCTADLHSLFMGKGRLHSLFTFDLSDEDNAFSYKGNLEHLNAAVLNPATRPLGLVKIKSGRIHSLAYNFNADNSGAYGSIDLKYDRLGISVLSKNKETGDLKKKGLASLAANLLVIKNNNVQDSLAVQHANVSHPREVNRSVFNLMWKSIFQGVKVVVGVDKQTENKLKSLKGKQKKIKQKVEQGRDEVKSVLKKVGNLFKKEDRDIQK